MFYSPKTAYEGGEPLQAFTALGQVADNALYQVEVAPNFVPWRRAIAFKQCTAAPIRPQIGQLEFIRDKTHWGYTFHFGLFEISQTDFKTIRHNMQA